jgi:NAD+ synthase (glutamine-hydrolysing)
MMTIEHKSYLKYIFMMNHPQIKVLMAQINPIVGAINENCQKIINIIEKNHTSHDLIVFPELAVCGYPPEDLILQPDFITDIEDAIKKIADLHPKCPVLIGCARKDQEQILNSVAFITEHSIQYYDKQALPNYGIFDEKRYFSKGTSPFITFEIQHHRFGVLICEDIWDKDTRTAFLKNKVQTLISINASPYQQHKHAQRLDVIRQISNHHINVLYLNLVGGQDELIFDGHSMAVNQEGQVCAAASSFEECLFEVSIHNHQLSGLCAPTLSPIAELYQALCCGLQDFIQKNGFKKVVLGLSGGIDSAVTLALAVEAIGAENVHVLLMPSPYTAQMSIDDAIEQANILKVSYDIIPIAPLFKQFQTDLQSTLNNLTQQNLQARIRGMLLMSYSNQHHALLLSTSNKSEAAVGYCTLYGDMCGGYAVLKDVYKMEVYALARHINEELTIIPERVIDRAPSAELAPNQTDQDDLPPYPVLDDLLRDIIEHRLSTSDLQKKGYALELIEKIYKRIKLSEFKRFQASPGAKVSQTALGRDWRFPITNHWKF